MGAGAGMIAAAGVSAAVSAYGYFEQRKANKTQSLLEESSLALEREQYRAQAQEQALSVASNFRQALASQLSLASIRGGAGSVVRQFGGSGLSSLNKDLLSVQRGISLNDIKSSSLLAQSRAGAAARNTSALVNFGMGLASAGATASLGFDTRAAAAAKTTGGKIG